MKARRSLLLALVLLSLPRGAFAVCTGPAGTAGDQIYNSNYNVMQYCNGSNWINMGTAGGIGPLIVGDMCTTDGTLVNCNTGTLPASLFPALTGDVTTTAGNLATSIAKIQGTAVSGTTGSGNVVFSASPALTGTVSGANSI